MRIVGGRLKGRALVTPKGRATRPTGERAREAIFNVLAHAAWSPGVEGARVIDLYAGSGALGFEALSRGAGFALFIDTDPAARGAVRSNADAFDVMGATRIHRRGATALSTKPAGLGAPFDLVFMDPPYRQGLVAPALAQLIAGGWLAGTATLVVETETDAPAVVDAATAAAGFAAVDERTYGAARITFARRVR